ncbi:MAG: polysaccharide deacetylase family protein [Clostridia bacterium]|nr:polysaccharide deacetylase family protein [Clostridia bacterium]
MIIKAKRFYILIISLFIIASSLLISADSKENLSNKIELPIIMYHHISKKYSALGDYVITPEQFENDLKLIKDKGYETITSQNLIDYFDGKFDLPEKPIMITFDDGYLSFYEYAYPLLQKYNMKAVFSIIGKYTDLYSSCNDRNINYAHVTWDDIKEMIKSGIVEMANHTYDLHTLNDRKGSTIKSGESADCYKIMLASDLKTVQNKLKEVTKITPVAFIYPFGRVCKQSYSIIEEMGFKVSFGCEEKINFIDKENPNLYKLKRFNRAHGKSSELFFKNILC